MQQITQNVLEFWFGDPPANEAREMWFKSGPELDEDIRARFLDTHTLVKSGGFDAQAKTAEDFLAAVIVLDQFPRNMFRGTAEAFATDGLAREWSDRAIAAGHHLAVPAPHMRIFFYLPFEHSEDLADQKKCLQLCQEMGHENYTLYAQKHLDVIAQFGRFPHRNAFLGRTSTPEEEEYLSKPGAGF
jgi:uncharacterized protein (DUF924 family)